MTEKRLPQEDWPGQPTTETLSRRRWLRWAPPLSLAVTDGFRLPGSGSLGTQEGGATGRTPARAAWGGRVPGGGAGPAKGPKGRGESAALASGSQPAPGVRGLGRRCSGRTAGRAEPRSQVQREKPVFSSQADGTLRPREASMLAGRRDVSVEGWRERIRTARGCSRDPLGLSKLWPVEAYDPRRIVQLGNLSSRIPGVSPAEAATPS